MGAPVLGPLFGWVTWLLLRKPSYQRDYIRGIDDFLSWFPHAISNGVAHLLINDVMMIVYILFFGLIGLSIDSALSR
ncbi:hypothetical protein [Colwellia sp. MB02u-14]|uniref:hypothetical protein n=1 Tax=Colwellia sp. MB02u-14 TaxID=2759815 RepID=UPI0015F77BBA|nr:hypothetical protein [Colwellia sp. MB02u-14]MBA6304946.1 hypothetical protein [Colwellia sp. MB02u-14]